MADIRIPIPKVSFNPPKYMVRKINKPFILDGDINKEFWKDVPYTDLFSDIEGESMPTPRYETRAKMVYDENALYIAAELKGDEIWANQTEHDCVIFFDNDFEIFIDPDSDTQEYVEYEMNANNANWDLLLTKAYRDQGSPINALELKGMQSAVKVNGTLNTPGSENLSWSVEVVIPFTTLNECSVLRRAPKAGEYYRLNFSRVQWKVNKDKGTYEKITNPETGRPLPEDNWVWASTGVINIHYPELWGFIFFTEGNEDYEIPEIEEKKWELRKVYYAEQIHKDLIGGYTTDRLKLENLLAQYSPIEANKKVSLTNLVIEATTNFFEASTSLDGNKRLVIFADGKVKEI